MGQTLTADNAILATAIIAVDTLWGGDVNNPSGLGRFIADAYFSGFDLPPCYEHPLAEKFRKKSEGVTGDFVNDKDVLRFVEETGLVAAINAVWVGSRSLSPSGDSQRNRLRAKYMGSLANSLKIMLQLALEVKGVGEHVSYKEAVFASTGQPPQLYDVSDQREQIIALMEEMGEGPSEHGGDLWKAVTVWRRRRRVARHVLEDNRDLIEQLDSLAKSNIIPHLPIVLREVPRTNVEFVLLEDAWFSGSLNYHGRKRDDNGQPLYEATYEINGNLEMSLPEFLFLISHEVVPGHIMNYALLHHLYQTEAPGYGFETTVPTMNSRASTLAEGLANNAILFAHGVRSVDELDDPVLRLGVLLSHLQDYAKANISYRTYVDMMPADEVAKVTRDECLLSNERAKSLSIGWAKHPLFGRMYMPSYAVGTAVVADLLLKHGPEKVIPVVYGAQGPVDVVTVQSLFE